MCVRTRISQGVTIMADCLENVRVTVLEIFVSIGAIFTDTAIVARFVKSAVNKFEEDGFFSSTKRRAYILRRRDIIYEEYRPSLRFINFP